MSRRRQIYYNALFGALGGLLGWLIVGSLDTGGWSIWLHNPFVGGGLGLFIGGLVGAVDGLVFKRSIRRSLVDAGSGAVAGLVSGLLGLLLGGAIFGMTGGGLTGRLLGWLFFGLFLGAGEGIISRSRLRISYGLVGGALAGAMGGIVYELVTQTFLSQSADVQPYLGALGLMLIGASLGGIIPFTLITMSKGILVVLNGRRQETEIPIVDSVTLGSYDGCEVYLPGDRQIDPKHASVYRQQGRFFVTDLGSVTGTRVNGQPVSFGASVELPKGGQVQLGETLLELK